MGTYRISNDAKDDLKRIYIRGFEEFGEVQADRYFNELHDKFQEIADRPLMYQAVDEIRLGYRRGVCKSNSIYYKISHEGVEIMAIIGRQDVNCWM